MKWIYTKLRAESFFETFKRSLNVWFRANWMCSLKVSKNEEEMEFYYLLYLEFVFCILSVFLIF